ncbi:hypothetical protein [Pseudogemmobacter faecipullorum]|uniref:hypothetical protein n=1 Tax=Pseudogemmobacter faecipullorum TaxID=2755041 RepID=UPI001D016ED3|nr:hypothetical protein [Pseudogemmobacter faecipullorum]
MSTQAATPAEAQFISAIEMRPHALSWADAAVARNAGPAVQAQNAKIDACTNFVMTLLSFVVVQQKLRPAEALPHDDPLD